MIENSIKTLLSGIEKHPDNKILRDWLGFLTGPESEKWAVKLTAAQIEGRINTLDNEKKAQQGADALLAKIKAWQGVEPVRPPAPEQDILCRVTGHEESWEAWEGDGMLRGDNLRTSRSEDVWAELISHPNIEGAKWLDTALLSHKRWAEHPIGKILSTASISAFCTNWDRIFDAWRESVRPHAAWSHRQFIRDNARIIDGKITIPVANSDGYPELCPITQEEWWVTPPWVTVGDTSWEDWEEFVK